MDQAVTLREKAKGFRGRALAPAGGAVPALAGGGAERAVRVTSVTSGKGGVGKTNVVANLAIALAQRGKRVMILDADLGLANIDIVLGLKPIYTIKHVLRGERSLAEVMITGPHGVRILPASSGVEELTRLTESEKIALLSELESADLDVDILLLDTSAGISSNVMYFNCASQEILVVATPEPTSITDAYALMKVLSKRYDEKQFRLLVNAVKDVREAKVVYAKLSEVCERFLNVSLDYVGFVPRDPLLQEAVQQQRPLMDFAPESPAALQFQRLAEVYLEKAPTARLKGNIQFFWKRLLWGQAAVGE